MNVTRENEQFKKRARAVKYNPRSLRRSDKRGQATGFVSYLL